MFIEKRWQEINKVGKNELDFLPVARYWLDYVAAFALSLFVGKIKGVYYLLLAIIVMHEIKKNSVEQKKKIEGKKLNTFTN